MSRLLRLLIILIPGFFLSIILIKLKSFSAPFVLISTLWFALFLIASITEKKLSIKIILFNMAAIILIFGFFELYFWRVAIYKLTYHQSAADPYRIEGIKYDPVEDDILGYALRKNSSRTVKYYYNDKVIYNVKYTIDKNGLRISPPPRKLNAPAILFFGDSYTYGEGVNDDETMPYLTGIYTAGEYAIYNFGIHGHGPQHMLAEIDHGIVDSVLTHKPQFAIYQAIPEHVERLKGLYPWLMKGPHYTLNENGEIIPSSISIPLWTRIKDKIPLLARIEDHIVQKSFFYNTIDRRILTMKKSNNKDTRENDVNTFVGVIDKSKNLLAKKYQGIEFHVIFWDNSYSKDIIEALEKKGIKIHKVSSILKSDDFWEFEKKSTPYRIPYDGHPSALTHKIMARYVVNEIIERKTE
jgi:hypothetical protein